MLKLYTSPRTRGTRAVWALEETGADYEIVPVALMRGEGRQPDYLAINPGGKVPTLVDGDSVITESGAIVTYLGEKFPESGLLPALGTPERGQFHRWSYFCMTELEQPLWTMAKHSFALPEKYRVDEVKPTAAWEFRVACKVLSKGLGDNDYVLGDTFYGVDILVFHSLRWASFAGLELEQDNLNAYLERLRSHPGLKRAVAKEKEVAAAME